MNPAFGGNAHFKAVATPSAITGQAPYNGRMSKIDVRIHGSGIVGRALALALARKGLHVGIDARPAVPAGGEARPDVRAYALNAASKALLESLRAWPDPAHATPVREMLVHGDEGGRVHFQARQHAVDALAWIVDVPALERQLADAVRFAPQDEVVSAPVACVGYCMSGPMAMWTAAAHPDRVAAVASFHGGHLVTGRPDSPHRLLNGSSARYYFGCAETDAFMTPAHMAELEAALDQAGRPHRIEVYPGTYHGFAIADASYDPAGGELHWTRLVEFLS